MRDACRRKGVPYFVFVHGALDPWFKRRYPAKHLKKALYSASGRGTGPAEDARAVVYARDEEEEAAAGEAVVHTVPRHREAIAPLGIEEPPGAASPARGVFRRVSIPASDADPALPEQGAPPARRAVTF